MPARKKRIAFLFIGSDRNAMLDMARRGEIPDSPFRGANIIAEQSDVSVEFVGTEILERRLPHGIKKFVPMSLVHLVLIPRLVSYDVVIASDAHLLGWIVSICSRTKWIFLTINSSVLIARHARHPLRRWLLSCAWKSFAAIVCMAEQQREDLISFRVPKEKISIIHFGVDTAYFNGGPSEEGNVVLSIGKDSGRDYATLLKAAAYVAMPIRIVASRKNIPSEIAVPPNVSIEYDLPLEKLKEAYAQARFVVVPSASDAAEQGSDCSGQTVILETLAMGRAVIATKRAWLTEYLAEGGDFVPVPPQDPEALARAMTALWEETSLRRGIAAHGQSTVRNRYTSRHFAEQLHGLIERIAV